MKGSKHVRQSTQFSEMWKIIYKILLDKENVNENFQQLRTV